MSDYIKLVTTAMRVTVTTPLLWFFGLFLSAGFNFNWLYLYRGEFSVIGTKWLVHMWEPSHRHPEQFVPATLFLFLILFFCWLAVNWIKTAFILNIADMLDAKRLGQRPDNLPLWQQQKKLFRQASKFLWPIAALSLFTIVAQGIVAFVLLSPWLWQKYIAPAPSMVVLAAALFIVFMLFFSLLNFFAVLFVALYQKNFSEAFVLATHFMKAKAKPLFATCVILLAIYMAGLWVGVQAISPVKPVFVLWLGILNIFFNTGLFIFFQTHVKPTKFEAEEKVQNSLVLKVSVDKTL